MQCSTPETQGAPLGQETLRILDAGRYRTAAGAVVAPGGLLRSAVEGSRSYPHDEPIPGVEPGRVETRIEVTDESTLAAARRLLDVGSRPVALKFASAKHPGGGFLSGAWAQEESPARSSGLHACLERSPRTGPCGGGRRLPDATRPETARLTPAARGVKTATARDGITLAE